MPAPDARSAPIPPEPATTPPILRGTKGEGVFETNWARWFSLIRTKINILNESIVNLSGLVGSGFLVKNGALWLLRQLAPGTGITITNPDGIAGNPVISHADTSSVPSLSSDNTGGVVLQDIFFTFDTFGHVTAASVGTTDLDSRYIGTSIFTGPGFVVANAGALSFRTLTAGTGISITNPTGVAGDPTISITGGPFEPTIAAGTTAQFWRGDKTWSDTLIGNLTIGTTPSYGGGTYIFFLQNASVVPTTNPSGGAIHYAEGGAAKVRGTSGTITTYGPANPHCPECGSDFVREYESAVYGYLAKCDLCASKGINSFTRTKGAWNVQE